MWNPYHNVWYLRSLIYASYSLLIIIFIHNMSTYVVWLLLENVSPHVKNIPLSSTRHKMRIKLSIINNWICNDFIKIICTNQTRKELLVLFCKYRNQVFRKVCCSNQGLLPPKFRFFQFPFVIWYTWEQPKKTWTFHSCSPSPTPGKLHPLNQPHVFSMFFPHHLPFSHFSFTIFLVPNNLIQFSESHDNKHINILKTQSNP